MASIEASHTAPESTDASGTPTDYVAGNAIDGDPTTAWRTEGSGVKEWLQLTLPAPVHILRIGLIPGYAKVDPLTETDRFEENRRILSVEYEFSDGTVVTQSFAEAARLQFTDVDVTADAVTILILSTTEPGGRDYTAISEVSLQGTP